MNSAPPVVLITGASRGLGRGMAVHLASEGYSVAVNYAANANAAEGTLEQCRAARRSPDQQFLAVRADVASAEAREAMVDQVLGALGGIDALVNNAGMAPRERNDLVEASEASFEELLRVNLQGPHFLTQRVAAHWLGAGGPSRLEGGYKVIFVTSISSYTASVNRGEYCISKAGLSMSAQLWAVRLAAEGIGVYELRPGIMESDMTSGVRQKYDALIAEGLVPQRRWGAAEDMGRAVAALLGGAFPFSTGAVIDVDGGFHLRRL